MPASFYSLKHTYDYDVKNMSAQGSIGLHVILMFM
jgi:hypothetical protein